MITVQKALFLFFAAMSVGAAFKVVSAREVFHAALWLILMFFGVGALYLLLDAPFMTGLQLFIYIGGVAVLNIMAIMVTRQMMHPTEPIANDPFTAALMALATFGAIVWMILQIPFAVSDLITEPPGRLAMIGEALVDLNGYVLPFEVASLLLLVVLISVMYLARERN